MAEQTFRSPLRKLVVFFHHSRDQWKQKCQDAKYELKLLKRRLANLQQNQDRWRYQYLEAEAERRRLEAEVERLSQERAPRC